ncbi:motA/TolQ/ExbB proton channel family protein, partial [Vibrio parahaemolyticus V-223/04]
QRPQA